MDEIFDKEINDFCNDVDHAYDSIVQIRRKLEKLTKKRPDRKDSYDNIDHSLYLAQRYISGTSRKLEREMK